MSGAGSTPDSRRVVLTRRAALATAAALALARSAPARADQKQERLAETLSAALTLELTAVESYGLLIASGVVRGRVRRALAACRVDDRRHAHVLRGALADVGATSPPPPLANEIASLTSATTPSAALQLALALEQQAIAAYLSTLHVIGRQRLVKTLGEAIAADAAHLVLLRQLAGQAAVPSAFETGT